MRRVFARVVRLWIIATILAPGCGWRRSKYTFSDACDQGHYQAAATRIEDPAVAISGDIMLTGAPITLHDGAPPAFWEMPLEEAVKLALTNSQAIRDLSGIVLRSPSSVPTVHGPAIQETDPRFGIEAALSAFDATFATSAFWENNDKALNNQFFGGGTRILKSDIAVFQTQISKIAATGTEFTIRHNTDYDANNAPGNQFPSAWNTNIETEVRHPLLQGGGVEFNRIAGPNSSPGVMAGVLLARVDSDISLADFELGVRNLVSDVENAYWDLYFAYRDLDAKVRARDSSLETWRRIRALYVSGRRGGEAEKEAQAREQYFRFQEQLQNSLAGRVSGGSSSSSGGTFVVGGGVHLAERRLRLLVGIPISDCRLIRPADEPSLAKVIFCWEDVLVEALARRAELRRQKWQVKRRELELIASRNFLMPQLDAVGRYRWRGFGHDLLDTQNANRPLFDNAVGNLTQGDFQEWQLGFELTFPFGMRQAHAAVRNAQFQLAREQAVLRAQEQQIVHDLSNEFAELRRAYAVVQTNYNRRLAAKQQLAAVQAAYESDNAPLDLVLEGQRRLADAESSYYLALTEYVLSVKNMHFHKGSLLDLNEVFLAEGPWPGKAYHDAARREHLRSRPLKLNNFILENRGVLSFGEHAQQRLPFAPNSDHPQFESLESAPSSPDLQQPESLPLPGEPLKGGGPNSAQGSAPGSDAASPTAARNDASNSPSRSPSLLAPHPSRVSQQEGPSKRQQVPLPKRMPAESTSPAPRVFSAAPPPPLPPFMMESPGAPLAISPKSRGRQQVPARPMQPKADASPASIFGPTAEPPLPPFVVEATLGASRPHKKDTGRETRATAGRQGASQALKRTSATPAPAAAAPDLSPAVQMTRRATPPQAPPPRVNNLVKQPVKPSPRVQPSVSPRTIRPSTASLFGPAQAAPLPSFVMETPVMPMPRRQAAPPSRAFTPGEPRPVSMRSPFQRAPAAPLPPFMQMPAPSPRLGARRPSAVQVPPRQPVLQRDATTSATPPMSRGRSIRLEGRPSVAFKAALLPQAPLPPATMRSKRAPAASLGSPARGSTAQGAMAGTGIAASSFGPDRSIPTPTLFKLPGASATSQSYRGFGPVKSGIAPAAYSIERRADAATPRAEAQSSIFAPRPTTPLPPFMMP